MKKKARIQTLRTTLVLSKYVLSQVWHKKYGKKYICLKFLISLLNTIFPLLLSIIPGLIINELTQGNQIDLVILFVAMLTTIPIAVAILNVVFNSYTYKLKLKLDLIFFTQFQQYVTKMDYEMIENPDNQIKKSRSESTICRYTLLVDKYIDFFSSVTKGIIISSVIFTLNPLVVLLIVVLIYINALLTKRINKRMYQIGLDLSKCDRYQWGISYMLEQSSYAKEIRLFRLSSLLIGEYEKRKNEANVLEEKQFRIGQKMNIYTAMVNFVQQLIAYAYTIYNVIHKNLALGSMTIYISMISQFSGTLKAISDRYLNISNENFSIQELIDFLNIPRQQYESGNKLPIFDGNSIIEFKNVSFKYPGNSNYALKNVNLKITGKEKVCIVGANGSGKSTFIKLLTRLYTVHEGEILLNGVNINEYDYEEYQKLFAPVFQDFVRYYFSLGTNIVLTSKFDKDKLDKICRDCGLKELVKKLPKGYDTQVDKFIDEEGFEPSGGEDQRIAIARACYKEGEIYLLDEPTASIDPMAEHEIYTQFNNMVTDKCAILITHRLSAVQLSDKIAVFDNGSVAEYGTHKELYKKGGIYTEMFDKQAQFYRDNNVEESSTDN